MNRALAALTLLLAFLLCSAGSASAYVDTGTKNRVGVFGGNFDPCAPPIGSQFLEAQWENQLHPYDSASDVCYGPNDYTYVRQNPYTKFDPLGLFEDNAHTAKWRAMTQDSSRNGFVRAGAIGMTIFEALNPFRSDSNLRQGGNEFQKNAAIARENLKSAPPVVREIGQFTMGVAEAGAAPLTFPAGLGEMGDSLQQVGPVQTGKNMAKGFVEHATSNPVEFAGEAMVGWATGKAMMGESPSGISARETAAPPKCFAAGTDVQTTDGEKHIESIKVGEIVYSYDLNTGKVVKRRVMETVFNYTYYWADVEVADEVIHATRGHKFWIESSKEWIEAAALKSGMVVRLSNGSFGTVTKIKIRALATPEATYNLIVDGEHNYFVGKTHVLVHNGYPDSPQYAPPTKVGETFQFNFDTSRYYRNSRTAGVREARALGILGTGEIGHHINSVQTHPHLAAEPSNIAPEATRASHLDTHGGSWNKPTTGPLNGACH